MNDSVRRGGWGEYLPLALGAVAVWLAWQVVSAVLVNRAPPELALRAAPGSPLALRRAAETEWLAKRTDNARELAAMALQRAPADARALRTYGLSLAEKGQTERADDLITLAGNWTLRDDPAHAWLVDRRLRQGNYASAFAHADTLVRRREAAQPNVFRLFTAAANADPRATAALVNLLDERPPWRTAYLQGLFRDGDQAPLLATVAVGLQRTRAPLNASELQQFYSAFLMNGRLQALSIVRGALNRPPLEPAVVDGGFPPSLQVYPFGWRLATEPGVTPSVTADELVPDQTALRVESDGFGRAVAVEQLLILKPGSHRFAVRHRVASGDKPRMRWTLTCHESGNSMLAFEPSGGASDQWNRAAVTFDRPSQACEAQWLRLETTGGERRRAVVAWFDDIRID